MPWILYRLPSVNPALGVVFACPTPHFVRLCDQVCARVHSAITEWTLDIGEGNGSRCPLLQTYCPLSENIQLRYSSSVCNDTNQLGNVKQPSEFFMLLYSSNVSVYTINRVAVVDIFLWKFTRRGAGPLSTKIRIVFDKCIE